MKNTEKAEKKALKVLMDAADRLAGDCVRIRRDLHEYPETGWTEFRTTCRIAGYLETAGLKAATAILP